VGDGGLLGAAFSVMISLPKASSIDSKVADRCKFVDTVEPESLPGWDCSGVSAATDGPSCVVSIRGGCEGDGGGLAGIAKVGEGQGILYGPRIMGATMPRHWVSGTDFRGSKGAGTNIDNNGNGLGGILEVCTG
jgi:hypothetical protein